MSDWTHVFFSFCFNFGFIVIPPVQLRWKVENVTLLYSLIKPIGGRKGSWESGRREKDDILIFN